jgi:hypothetical protein
LPAINVLFPFSYVDFFFCTSVPYYRFLFYYFCNRNPCPYKAFFSLYLYCVGAA